MAALGAHVLAFLLFVNQTNVCHHVFLPTKALIAAFAGEIALLQMHGLDVHAEMGSLRESLQTIRTLRQILVFGHQLALVARHLAAARR